MNEYKVKCTYSDSDIKYYTVYAVTPEEAKRRVAEGLIENEYDLDSIDFILSCLTAEEVDRFI